MCIRTKIFYARSFLGPGNEKPWILILHTYGQIRVRLIILKLDVVFGVLRFNPSEF